MTLTKRIIQLLVYVLFFSLAISAQDSTFTIGVWTTAGPIGDDYPPPPDSSEVKSLGVDLVLHTAKPEFNSYLSNFDKVIALNSYEQTDLVHKYSGGYYTRWEAEQNEALGNKPGLKHPQSGGGYAVGSAWYCSPRNVSPGTIVITGPDYIQDQNYRFYFDTSKIYYRANFRMKIGRDTEEHFPVCKISVKYVTIDQKDSVLVERTIYSDQLSTSYKLSILEYSIPDTIEGSPVKIKHSISPEVVGNLIEETAADTSKHGVQFNVEYLGNESLYVDYIEVYDTKYWIEYINSPSDVADQIKDYADSVLDSLTNVNIDYWYSLDEPKTIDNYEPYRTVLKILSKSSNLHLIPEGHYEN